MNKIRLTTVTLLAAATILMFTGSSLAQTRPGAAGPRPSATPATNPAPTGNGASVPATRIAFVDTSVFGDEKAGIARYIAAVKSVEREFQPRQTELNNMQTRIKAVVDEYTKLSSTPVVDQKSVQAKREEGERLELDFKNKKDAADAAFTKRYEEVVGPVSADIGKALDQFAQLRGITMTLDISKLIPAVLTVNPSMDVTQAFIAEFNSKYPVTASATKP
jgi:Skp family chaperone for outer membrane proteins